MKKNGNPACFDKETLLVTCHSYLSRLIMIAKTENEISQITSKNNQQRTSQKFWKRIIKYEKSSWKLLLFEYYSFF